MPSRYLIYALCIGLGLAGPAFAAAINPAPNKVIRGGAPNNGAYKVLDFRRGDCSGCVVDGVVWNVDRIGIDARGWSNFTLKNSEITLRQPTDGGDLPAGIVISAGKAGAGGTYFILNNVFRDFKMLPVKDKYMQGESVNCDDRAAQVTLVGNRSYGNGDAGYDLKCIMVEMSDNYAEGANYGYRLWGRFTAGANTSHNPKRAHVGLSAGTNGVIDHLIVTGDTGAALVHVSRPGARLEIRRCTIALGKPARVLSGPRESIQASSIVLGPSCQPDADGFAVNTETVAPAT